MKSSLVILVGILSTAASVAFEPISDDKKPARAFVPKLFPVGVDGKWGYIDRTGKIAIPATYYWAFPFQEGVALVYTADPKNPAHFIDETGKIVLTPPFTHDFESFSDGFARGSIGLGFHFMDRKGNLLPQRFAGSRPFSEGLAAVNINPSRFELEKLPAKPLLEGPRDQGKWGFIDKSGRLFIPADYIAVGSFSEGLAAVYVGGMHIQCAGPQGGKWGYIDPTGKLVIGAQFQFADAFSEGLAQVYGEDRRVGYVDKNGKVVIPPRFRYPGGRFREGLAAACIAEPQPTIRQRNYGYIDAQGKTVIEPQFTNARDFSEGRASVALENSWGIIDKSGTFILPPKYNQIGPFMGGLACVQDPPELGYVDTQGRFVWPMTRWAKPK